MAGQTKNFNLGPHEYNSTKAQSLVTVLPPKTVTASLPTPPEGSKQFWSGAGDGLDNSLTRQVTLPAGKATLTFKTSYNIESGYDYGYVQVDDGSGLEGRPGQHHGRHRGQRDQRGLQGLRPGDLRPVGLRRQDDRRCASAT